MVGGYLIIDDNKFLIESGTPHKIIDDKQLADSLIDNDKPVLFKCALHISNDGGLTYEDIQITAWLSKVVLGTSEGPFMTTYTTIAGNLRIALQLLNDQVVFIAQEVG